MYKYSNIGFIGAGNIAQALIKGMLENEVLRTENTWASAPSTTNLEKMKHMGINVTNKNEDIVNNCEVVILCVKPFKAETVLGGLKKLNCWKNHLMISVVSGLNISTLESFCPPGTRVIRAMPNTPIAVQTGVFAFVRGSHCTLHDSNIVHNLFGTLGLCEEIEETMINTVCGLSGSGPAFVYTVVQSLSDGGVKMGLPRALSTKFAAQTVMGAAKMVLETGKHPDVLRDEVCSPAGTTIYGINALEKAGIRAAFIDAVEAATSRANQQSQNLKKF